MEPSPDEPPSNLPAGLPPEPKDGSGNRRRRRAG
uniref:Uncharacterized protein n=1 Tax=Arundo donax TaxID=35708 RepID=A0A0A9E5I4_ARUDO